MVSLATPTSTPTAGAGDMLPPPTPPALSRRPTIGMKRGSSFMSTDSTDSLTSTITKKLKVAFDDKVDVRFLSDDDWDEKSFDLVKEEVRLGIERHLAPEDHRDDAQYVKLLALLGHEDGTAEALSGKLLKKYLVAIDARVGSLGGCSKLATAALDVTWLGRDEVFAGLYVKFVVSLATAQSKFITSITDRLVAPFVKLPASMWRLAGEVPVSKPVMFRRLHAAIRALLRQVPSAAAALARSLKAGFPNDLATTRSYVQYQKHLLRLTEHVPELRAEIMSLVTQRLVGIDVQIQQDVEDLEEVVDGRILHRPRSRDVNKAPADIDQSDDSDIDSISESEETVTEDEQRLRELRLKLDKMDYTLDMLFDYYTPLIQADLRPSTNEAYQQLLSHFTTFILPHRTRHAQFLLFHFSQLTPAHASAFATHCLTLATRPSATATLRLTACAYVASFIARGSHIPPNTVRDVFIVLFEFLEEMRVRYEPTCRGPDRRGYSLYYAIAQAVLYIFCFRWRDLVEGAADPEDGDDELSEEDLLAEGKDLEWLPRMKEIMTRNCQSRLNLLKVCSPAIVGEFAKLAHHVRFVYVFSVIETNKRVRLGQMSAFYGPPASGIDVGRRETAWDRKSGEAHLQLEAYFPFDPFLLPNSRHWVQGDYNEWKLPRGMRTAEDDGSDGEEEDSEDSESDSDDDSMLDEEEDLGDLPGDVDTDSVSS